MALWLPRAWVQSPVRELRFCKLSGKAHSHPPPPTPQKKEKKEEQFLHFLFRLESTPAKHFACLTLLPSFPFLLRNGRSFRGSVFTSHVLWRTQDSPRGPPAQVTSQHSVQFHACPRTKWNHPYGDTQNCRVRRLNRSRWKFWRAELAK